MEHPGDEVLEALALGKLTTAESLRVQKHAFNCPDCLRRLIDVETLLAIADDEHPPYRLKPDLTKPVFVRHDTADGFIYSRVEKNGEKWLERHWGDQLQGRHECATGFGRCGNNAAVVVAAGAVAAGCSVRANWPRPAPGMPIPAACRLPVGLA